SQRRGGQRPSACAAEYVQWTWTILSFERDFRGRTSQETSSKRNGSRGPRTGPHEPYSAGHPGPELKSRCPWALSCSAGDRGADLVAVGEVEADLNLGQVEARAEGELELSVLALVGDPVALVGHELVR